MTPLFCACIGGSITSQLKCGKDDEMTRTARCVCVGRNKGFNAGFTRQARDRIAGLLSCSSAPFSRTTQHQSVIIVMSSSVYRYNKPFSGDKHISVKTVSVETMTSVSPFCGVHSELYSHVEWRLFGWCLSPNLGIISPYLVPGIVFAFFCVLCGFFLRCCAFCFAFFCGFLRLLRLFAFLIALVRSRANGYREMGGLRLFSCVGFEVKRRACKRGGRKEERGNRFILRG